MEQIDLDTFVISDFHLGHTNIIKYCDRPHNHEELIVSRWNEVVKDEDTVLFLGDLTFLKKDKTKEITDKLKGKKFMLKGNHDRRSNKFYQDCGFTVVDEFSCTLGGRVVLFTHVQTKADGQINIHGHSHNSDHRGKNNPINVSCEMLDYRPIRIKDLLK